MNLYGFAGGDPVNFSDPLGLKVCYKGTASEVADLRKGTEDATGTTITLDKDNCVESSKANGEKGFEEIQSRFDPLVASSADFGVEFSPNVALSSFGFDNQTRISKSDYQGGFYSTGNAFTCAMFDGSGSANYTLGALIAHELIGHGGGVALHGKADQQPTAIRIENQYHAARHQPKRCGGGR